MKVSLKFVLIVFALLALTVLTLSCSSNETTPVAEHEEEAEETKTYDGVFKLTGEAIEEIDGTQLVFDPNYPEDEAKGNYTDIVIEKDMTDLWGNVFTPGTYEFQFVEFPEDPGKGAWYIYINDEKVSGNPNASDSGKEYELEEGDVVSVEFWSIATFYKVEK